MAEAQNPIVVIPARMAASRLPGKPLAQIAGVPMIVQVLRRAQEADVGPVVVAAGDREILEAVEAAGGRAIMTDPDLPSGSDRIHQALERCDPERRHNVVVNLQGDLPTLDSAALRTVLVPLSDTSVDIATLCAEIKEEAERTNPNVVKIACLFEGPGRQAKALYFSRAPIPWDQGNTALPLYHHIGIYAYRRQALDRFVSLPPSPLEKREKLEQLRALEAGMRLGVACVDTIPLGVDTPADLERARQMLSART
ncbi:MULTISPECIES: 3-deoxy-manno-octulosonate cytidylyltransferase [Limibacillus]|jgi:3-deoxy-manno-octulosonate cytidylyltransferase (CMP-KDO synthetase)|uniref:3-deoxy-manno-octulosonate cytidylyltransferase n=1 Tax=Limibacillus halophilus TaxID=1579333 RepID=A0A839SYT9_9PROT|nr:3-deoxy-manno-octulosonate cytidylyltransferase [Limibacillus halophilus]MBB3066093.1 3-deoxy-manno-octulosonate cytidylyltransferase (CMP-KDO synthetase) [Limibacillus halophilus]